MSNLSKVIIQDMKDVDGSNMVRYSAVYNGRKLMMQTDGILKHHLTEDEFIELATNRFKEDE